jgi:Flp pilus assembly CpaE family ATPase
MVDQLGFPKERFQVLLNRVDRRDNVAADDMEKLFGCKVHVRLPNDYFSLHRVVTLGQPLGAEGELGKAIEGVASLLSGALTRKPKTSGTRDLRPVALPA